MLLLFCILLYSLIVMNHIMSRYQLLATGTAGLFEAAKGVDICGLS